MLTNPRDTFRRHCMSPNMVPCDMLGIVSYYRIFVPKMHCFWDIQLVSTQWPWNPGNGSLKVIGTNVDLSTTYDFLLSFHSNHGPISYLFHDKRWFQSKIANFPTTHAFCAPADGIPLGIGYRRMESKTRMRELPDGQKSFKIGLAV